LRTTLSSFEPPKYHPREARTTGADELFFELSHEKRLAILKMLSVKSERLTDIAVKARISAPEAVRHLRRLARQKLIARDSDGVYGLTPYGRLVTDGLASFEFLLRQSDFLRNHNLAGLPKPFVTRLAELSELEAGSSFSDTLRHVERVLNEADDFAWFLSDQALLTSTAVLGAAKKSGVTVRVVVPESLLRPAGSARTPDRPIEAVEIRVVPEVRVGIAMNERIAGVSFPDSTGRIDHSAGFRGSSAEFRGWCRDLFQHYWDRGRRARLEG
jgi:predicted transcriptional regulator